MTRTRRWAGCSSRRTCRGYVAEVPPSPEPGVGRKPAAQLSGPAGRRAAGNSLRLPLPLPLAPRPRSPAGPMPSATSPGLTTEGTPGHEHLGHRHRQPDPQPAAVAHRRRHPGRQPQPRRQRSPPGGPRVGGNTTYWQVCCFGAQAEHVTPRCTAAPARSRSAPSAPTPGAAPRARTSRRWRSSPTRSAPRCAGPPPRAPAPRADQTTNRLRPEKTLRAEPNSRQAGRRRATRYLSIYISLHLSIACLDGPEPAPRRGSTAERATAVRPMRAR